MRRRYLENKEKQLFIKRFYPAGTYTWTVPNGCEEVDVFLVGGGGGSGYNGNGAGAGGGYTKTFKSSTDGWRDGDAIQVTPGQEIQIIVGKGGNPRSNGGYSQFMNSNYKANGGYTNNKGWDNSGNGMGYVGGNGGSGGGCDEGMGATGAGGSDGGDGSAYLYGAYNKGKGQGHTTRDFGEPNGKRNAGGGAGDRGTNNIGGASDYTEGSGNGSTRGGGGYGGGAGSTLQKGGDGTVLIRYYAYEE
jgi:hypothetical protein